jgi:biopolymer transport protein ExbD
VKQGRWPNFFRSGRAASSSSTLTATCCLALAQIATGQSLSSDVNAEALSISISADGVCHFLDSFTPCNELGRTLLSKHLARNGDIHITVDRNSKYQLLASTLKSLEDAGFKKIGEVAL